MREFVFTLPLFYYPRKLQLGYLTLTSRRKYYDRVNDLIRQYMYIDTLLDSSIPHELLNEYSARLDASAFRTVEVPQTIHEETSSTHSSTAKGANHGSSDSASLAGAPGPQTANKKQKRTAKDIFRSSESTPLLARDEEEAGAESAKPCTPWLEEADLDHDDPIVTLAIFLNTVANVILLVAKIIVVASVPSMSVLASLVDAVLDFLSTAIVWTTTRLISASQTDQYRYPVGRRRLVKTVAQPLSGLSLCSSLTFSFSTIYANMIDS